MVSQNSINNTVFDNDFSVNRSGAGIGVQSIANHRDNTNPASDALVGSQVAGAAGGDPFVGSRILGAQSWSMGLDNSVALDPLKITLDPAVATPSTGSLAWNMVTSGAAIGARTMPLQPCFYAELTVSATNTTGAGAFYNIGNNSGGTTVRTNDQGSNLTFVGGDLTYTAPVSGMHLLGMQISALTAGIAGETDVECTFVKNGAVVYFGGYQNYVNIANSTLRASWTNQRVVFLSVGDTITFRFAVSGGAGNNITVLGGGNGETVAYGSLLC